MPLQLELPAIVALSMLLAIGGVYLELAAVDALRYSLGTRYDTAVEDYNKSA